MPIHLKSAAARTLAAVRELSERAMLRPAPNQLRCIPVRDLRALPAPALFSGASCWDANYSCAGFPEESFPNEIFPDGNFSDGNFLNAARPGLRRINCVASPSVTFVPCLSGRNFRAPRASRWAVKLGRLPNDQDSAKN